MRVQSASSQRSATSAALDDTIAALGAVSPTLLLVFATPDHDLAGAATLLQARYPSAEVVGCTASGTIGGGREVESAPSLVLISVDHPGAVARTLHADAAVLPSGPATAADWAAALGVDAPRADERFGGVIVISDPFTLDVKSFLAGLGVLFPGVPAFGGQASGGRGPGSHVLVRGGVAHRGGAIAVVLAESVQIELIVAQGCRPIGQPMFVTRCEGNRLLELDGEEPVAVLRRVVEALPDSDKLLARQSLLLGVQARDQNEYGVGDYLIRHIHGVPSDGRGVLVAAQLGRYQVVQLHVRDAASARADLLMRLQARSKAHPGPPEGVLLFSCVGRGEGLFGSADHDSRLVRQEVGEVPIGGFFANGEVGPVHGEQHVHGYTSVVALLYGPRD
jgi:small ligand-binding sensory domain FIST